MTSDLIETLRLMCGQNEIQEVPRSFLVDLYDEIERLSTEHGVMLDALQRIARHAPEDTPFGECKYDLRIAKTAIAAVSGKQPVD